MNEKEKTLNDLCQTILQLEMKKGHLNWSISDIAKKSGYARSLIYYYFGKDKKSLYLEAVEFVANAFYAPEDGESFFASYNHVKKLMNQIEQMPHMLQLYTWAKLSDSETASIITKYEMDLLKRHNNHPRFTDTQILQKFITVLGALIYKNISDDELKQIFCD